MDFLLFAMAIAWFVYQLIAYYLIVSKGKKITVTNPDGSSISGEIERTEAPTGKEKKSDLSARSFIYFFVTQMLLFIGLVLLSPVIGNSLCENSREVFVTKLPVVVKSKTGKTTENLVVEVNGDATGRQTNLSGYTEVEITYECGLMPGCLCEDSKKVEFVVFDGRDKIATYSDEFSTQWLSQTKTEKYEIPVD